MIPVQVTQHPSPKKAGTPVSRLSKFHYIRRMTVGTNVALASRLTDSFIIGHFPDEITEVR
jgi:hypothetical protein